MAARANQQLWYCNNLVHHRDLLAVLPFEVALFKSDEESSETCPTDERVAGKDQGDEADGPATEGTASGTAEVDERGEPPWRMSAAVNPDAFSLRTLQGHHHLAGFSAGELS